MAAVAGIDAETDVRTGPAVEQIFAAADACDPELIVVGSRGRGAAVMGRLLGSASRDLVAASPRPVLIVRPVSNGPENRPASIAFALMVAIDARAEDVTVELYDGALVVTYSGATRTLSVPNGLTEDDVEAQISAGVLTITVPMPAPRVARHIPVAERTAVGGPVTTRPADNAPTTTGR